MEPNRPGGRPNDMTTTCTRCAKTVTVSSGGYPATHKTAKEFVLPDGTPFTRNVRCSE